MNYKIGCGRTLGHGSYCAVGYLCSACEEVQRLRKQLGLSVPKPPPDYTASLISDHDAITQMLKDLKKNLK